MPLQLRDARPTDLDFLVAGNCCMARETEGVDLDPGLVGPGTRAVLEDPALGRYFVAEVDGAPVGQLMLTYEWSDWRNGVFWWIQSVYVEPAHRGQGVFSALFRHVASLARTSAGVCGLRLYVDRANRRAQAVYQHLGLHPTNYDVMEDVFRGPASHRDG
jgi:GNAT superfamily N-acetyltransferase